MTAAGSSFYGSFFLPKLAVYLQTVNLLSISQSIWVVLKRDFSWMSKTQSLDLCHPSAQALHWWSYWILRRMAKWSQMVVSGQFHQFLKDSSTSGHRLLRLKFSCGCLNDLFFMEERGVIKRWIINSIKHLRVGSLKLNSSSNKRLERVDNYQMGSTFFRFLQKGSLQYGFWIWMRHNASSNYNLWVVTPPPLPQAHTHIYTF